jgi:transcriptional regulator with XRE-family HTH domain
MDDGFELGRRFATLRTLLGASIAEVASATGLTDGAVASVEGGDLDDRHALVSLTNHYGLSPIEFQEGSVLPRPDAGMTVAVYLMEGSIRRISFEAFDLDEARRLATKWGLGLEGESTEDPIRATHTTIAPAAFDVVSACRVLGDISRTTLYRLLLRGKLERLPATRKVLVTRRSIERFCSTPTRCETIGR